MTRSYGRVTAKRVLITQLIFHGVGQREAGRNPLSFVGLASSYLTGQIALDLRCLTGVSSFSPSVHVCGPFQMGMSMLRSREVVSPKGKGVKFGLGIPMGDGNDLTFPFSAHLALRTQARPGICKC